MFWSLNETRTRPVVLRASNSGAYILSQRREARTGLKDSGNNKETVINLTAKLLKRDGNRRVGAARSLEMMWKYADGSMAASRPM